MKHFVLKIVLAQILLMVCASVASAQLVQLLGYTNQTWRYNETSTTGSNPQGLFQAPGFDDTVAGWKTGFPLFGNDDPGVYNGVDDPFRGGLNGFATPLDRSGGRVTFYFRTHINLASAPDPNATLYGTNYLDDGAIWYINGTEIGRMRVPAAPATITWDTLGSNPPTEGIAYPITFGPEAIAALHVGDNVLAVEVHQSSTGSSDVAFAMNLILINPFCVQILDNAQPADVSVVENRSFTLRAVANASPPITYQWVHDGVDIPTANSATYRVALAATTDAGSYYCRISNPVCTRFTRTNTVTYTQDDNPPQALSALSGDFKTITVKFDEAMDPISIGDNFNWVVTDAAENSIALLDPVAATLSADGTIVTLALDPTVTLQENALYTVGLSAIYDLTRRDPNNVLYTNIAFRTYVSGCSGFFFEAFDTASTPGNLVSLLTSHPNFPNNPRQVFRLPSFDTRHVYPQSDETTREQFGGRVRGLFVPTSSGQWTFYLASDDNSELWVNPTGPSSTGRQLIAEERNCCNNFLPANDATTGARNSQTSVPINLTAGQAYYVEALYKEGGGGDWLKVAARPSGDSVPTGGNSEAGQVSAAVLQGGPGPAGILSSVNISGQPANQTVVAGGTATFSVTLSSDVPACYQWKQEGVDIAGAIGPVYKRTVSLADDNTHISVQVSLMGGTVRDSSSALLHVFTDTTPPTVTSIGTDVARTNITLTFSEPMEAASSTATGNYSIPGTTVQGATLSNPTTVQLRVSPALNACQAYTLSITGVKDANTVLIAPTNITFTGSILVLDWDAATIWKYWDAGTLPAGSWKDRTYDDSTWASGPAVLGFEPATYVGDSPLRTPISNATAINTAYFRAHFNLNTDPSTVTSLQIRQIMDDGGVYYINGSEVYRSRMNAGAVTHTTLASAGGPEPVDGTHPTEGPFDAVLSSLRYGDNVIAVELHPSSTTSSDSVFGATLSASVTRCAAPLLLSISRSGNQVTITSTAPGTIYKASSLAGPWSSVGAAPQTVTIGPGNQFFEIR